MNNFQELDILNLFSLLAQFQNMNNDEQYHVFINKMFENILKEVEELHKENDIIIKQNEEILKLLKGGMKSYEINS